jgi:hypothetical protein
MTNLTRIFDTLDDWRHLPAYQLERRADIFFALYLPDLLRERLGFEIEGLIPEFPLHKATIYPDEGNNQSARADYLAKAGGCKAAVLVELKTDQGSRSDKQDASLERAREVGLAALLRGVGQIVGATDEKRKYRHLLHKLEELDLITLAPDGRLDGVAEGYALHLVYVQPGDSDGAEQEIGFHEAAEVIERRGDALSRRFAASLREWADVKAGERGRR